MFQLYQALLKKTTQTIARNEEKQEYAMKDALFEYLKLVVELMDGSYTDLIKGGRVVIDLLKSADYSIYASFATLILIKIASEESKINVSEKLIIDCDSPESSGSALFLTKKILLASLDNDQSLNSMEDYLYILSQISLGHEVEKFIRDKTTLVFENQSEEKRDRINSQIGWFRDTLLEGSDHKVRKLHYLAICLLS